MPTIYTNEGAIDQATAAQAHYEDAEVHLFQAGEITIGPGTTLAELEALEADFTGYLAQLIDAWLGPMMAPGSGAMIWSGGVYFATASPYTVPNNIMGWWLQTAAGKVVAIGTYPTNIPMQGAGDSIPWEILLPFGQNVAGG